MHVLLMFVLSNMKGRTLFKLLKDVSIEQGHNELPIEFQSDGSQRFLNMKVVNLQSERDGNSENKNWQEIGEWQIHRPGKDDFNGDHGSWNNVSYPAGFDSRFVQSKYIIIML